VVRTSSRTTPREADRSRALGEVEFLAWLLDNSIPVPGTGGRRFGIDALIGFVPVVGDIFGGLMSVIVVWRGSRMGLPRIVVLRMLTNAAVDFVVGAVPLAGDAFDLWFKVNERNLGLIRRHLERPETSTRNDWLVVIGFLAAIVLLLAAAVWLLIEVISTIAGIFA
jgi:hypothetical protein